MEQKVTDIGVLNFEQGEYGGEFTAKKTIGLFSRNYEIIVRFDVFDHGFEGLADETIRAAKVCLDTISNQAAKIEKAIKRYYDTEVKSDAEEGLCNYVKMNNINQLSQVVEPKELFVQKLKKTTIIGLYFNCDWAEYEGFAIKFDTKGNIVEMGTGEIIY